MPTLDAGPPVTPTNEFVDRRTSAPRVAPWKRLLIWGGFLLLIYLARDFFFLAFMTFMFSYLALGVVGWIVRRLPERLRGPGGRRLVTLGVFIVGPLILVAVGVIVAPTLIAQGQRLAGWLGQLNPENEVARMLETYVGPAEFRRTYGGPDDPRYQKALDEFRRTGERHVEEYIQFPALEAWLEGAFGRQFSDHEAARIRSRLLAEGTTSADFERWFLNDKYVRLRSDSAKDNDALAQQAAKLTGPQLLEQVRREPATLARLRDEWVRDAVERGITAAKQSPEYEAQFRSYYDQQREQSPQAVPYTFDQFLALQKVRPNGRRAFGETLDRLMPGDEAKNDASVTADFEAAAKHDLFQTWWSTNSTAKFIRHTLESRLTGDGAGWMSRVASAFLNIPVDLFTALLLSFFICIDFPALQRAGRSLRDTWLHDVYDEIVPALSSLALLIGRSMQAQGLIALCNATLMFIALSWLGVEHAALLSAAVFVLCLVPTIGMMIAWVILVIVALVQPGGGVALALQVTGAVVAAVALETFVLSPRILGRLMELHPVLIIAILPVAHYFFGVWGLILAIPVSVYVIRSVIFRTELPGIDGSQPEIRTPVPSQQP
jgi:predicted PurR-regulated permease PerM